MGFFIGMFMCNISIPAIMCIAGYMMYAHPPKQINGVIGYRTKMSSKNEDTWSFAHNYCGKLWIKSGIILMFLTVAAQLPFIHSSDNVVSIVTLIIEAIQLVFILGSVYLVEKALKGTFDKDGNRR